METTLGVSNAVPAGTQQGGAFVYMLNPADPNAGREAHGEVVTAQQIIDYLSSQPSSTRYLMQLGSGTGDVNLGNPTGARLFLVLPEAALAP